jgi:spermidine synthase/MFS family permease
MRTMAARPEGSSPHTSLPPVLLLAFLAGAAVMAAELAAPRLLAPQLGAGMMTWSAIFGVFLGAMALGNAVGGRLADRGFRRALPLLFGAGGVALLAAVPIHLFLEGSALDLHLSHLARTLVVITLTFVPGAFVVGMIGPTLARSALATGVSSGRALGAVSSAGALGSVAGTFCTGFLLVPHMGTRAIYLAAGLVLVACVPIARRVPDAPRRAPPPASGPLPRGWTALAALAGFALLVVEVVSARVAANRLGTSVYTWTSVLGVVLVALGIGNAIGGRLADRFAPRPLLGGLLLAASVSVASCLWTPALMTYVAGWDLPWLLRTLLAVFAAFALPSAAIGTLSPAVIRAALGDPAVDGRTIGRLYAVGTAGAVAGSFLAGYVLIPLLQVPLLLVLMALALALAAWRLGGRGELPWIVTLVVVALLCALPFEPVRALGLRVGVREDAPGTYVEDSRYFHIGVEPHNVRWVRLDEPMDRRIVEKDAALRGHLSFEPERRLMFWRGAMTQDQEAALLTGIQELGNRQAARVLARRVARPVRLLSLDRFVHGFVDLEDPLWLEYEYEILQGALLRTLWPTRDDPRCFFIGGGAYTFQRRLLALYTSPTLQIVSAEIDPAVTRVARSHLGLEEDPRHTIVHDDARTRLRGGAREATPQDFDIIFGDAFHDLGVPWHLTTQEFVHLVHERLRPDGFYLLNLIDVFASGRFLGAMLTTLESEFEHVRVVSMGPRDDHSQETFLLLASDRPLAWDALVDDDGRPLSVVAYTAEDLEAVRVRSGRLLLRDDFAPVEMLLAPVVQMRATESLRGRR